MCARLSSDALLCTLFLPCPANRNASSANKLRGVRMPSLGYGSACFFRSLSPSVSHIETSDSFFFSLLFALSHALHPPSSSSSSPPPPPLRRRRGRSTVNELDQVANEDGHAAAEERFISDLKQQISELKASLAATETEVGAIF